jgi:hypothetical protein
MKALSSLLKKRAHAGDIQVRETVGQRKPFTIRNGRSRKIPFGG